MSTVGAIVEARAATAPSRRRADPGSVVRERATLLSTVPLFADLSKRHLRQLSKLASETNVRSGGYIVQAGQPGRAFYVILEGRAKVVRGVGPSVEGSRRSAPETSSGSWRSWTAARERPR